MKHILTITLLGLSLLTCKKIFKHPCHNESLARNTMGCTTDCPGFVACNGKTYCNACEAAREGFGPK